MKKHLYYRAFYSRRNVLRENVYGFFDAIASRPKLLLEVFIRKNFGYRYINTGSVISVALIMLFIPLIGPVFRGFMNMGGISTDDLAGGQGIGTFAARYFTWYAFLFAFLKFARLRLMEIKRDPSSYDFTKFSKYSGDIDPAFYKLPIFRTWPTIRQVEILGEPTPFLAIALILIIIGQPLGWLLFTASITYGISYAAMYKKGDDMVADLIDEGILNEEKENAFVNDDTSRGVRFYMRKPDDLDLRRRLAGLMVEDEEGDDDLTIAA